MTPTETNQLYDSNLYIKHFNELELVLELFNLHAYSDYNQPKKKWFKKKEESFENEFNTRITEKISRFIRYHFGIDRRGEDADYIRGYTLTFEQLWDFCQFVRYAEKVLFYENVMEDNKLFVTSTLTDVKTRKLVIKHDKVDISITLEKEDTSNDLLKILKIEIVRNYGKIMKNEYVIVDNNTDRFDISDNILISNTNRIIYKYVLNTYLEIIEKFLKDIKESVRWKTENWTIYKLDKVEEVLSEYV